MNESGSDHAGEMFRKKLEVSARRVDQGITAHSYLRDKYSRQGAILSFLVISAASVITFLAVASEGIRAFVWLSPGQPDQAIGVLGFVVLLVSVLEIQLGWREKSSAHAEAASALSRLKLLIGRELGSELSLTEARYQELHQAYENVNDLIARIPERKFLVLKAIHKRKVEMSKILDESPGAFVALLRLKIWLRDNLTKWPERH